MEALPIGLSEGCVLRHDVAKDEIISFNDVDQPGGRLPDMLWMEQCELWPQVTEDSQSPSIQHVHA